MEEAMDNMSINRNVRFNDEIIIINDVIAACDTNDCEVNPLLAILEFDDDELKSFMRISLTKVNRMSPGINTNLTDAYISKWKLVIDAFQNKLNEESFHDLIVELWPYIAPRNSKKKWELQQFIDMVIED